MCLIIWDYLKHHSIWWTKDFIDYMLITSNEFKNRLDKVTCFLVDGDLEIVNKVKEDRIENPDSRLIVPFSISELNETFTKIQLSNRMREFLYERDLFGIAVPLKNDILFFEKDRTDIISELYGRYKQGEEGGLFGLRRIGKTSILNLLKLRIAEAKGVIHYAFIYRFMLEWFVYQRLWKKWNILKKYLFLLKEQVIKIFLNLQCHICTLIFLIYFISWILIMKMVRKEREERHL